QALIDKVLRRDTLSSLSKVEDLVSTISPYLSVDSGFTTTQMVKLGWSMRNLRSDDIKFLTAPNNGTGRAGKASIVKLDADGVDELGTAINKDKMQDYVSNHS